MIYVIIEASEVDSVDFSQVVENNANSIRYKADDSQAIVKFEGDTPSFLIGKPQYTREEILSILSGPEWTDPDAVI